MQLIISFQELLQCIPNLKKSTFTILETNIIFGKRTSKLNVQNHRYKMCDLVLVAYRGAIEAPPARGARGPGAHRFGQWHAKTKPKLGGNDRSGIGVVEAVVGCIQ